MKNKGIDLPLFEFTDFEEMLKFHEELLERTLLERM